MSQIDNFMENWYKSFSLKTRGGCNTQASSGENELPVRCGGRVEAHPNLRGGVFLLRQLRQFVSAEIRAAGRFEVFLEFTANQPAKNKDLGDTIGVGRRIVPIAVLRRNQPQRGDVFFHGSAGLLYLPANPVMKFFLQIEQNYSF